VAILIAAQTLVSLACAWPPTLTAQDGPAVLRAEPSSAPSLADLLRPLPYPADRLARRRTDVGPAAQALETDHFAVVYTATDTAVRDLSARLEAVYRANVRFGRDLRLPLRSPVHKLDVLVFGTFDQFRAYRTRSQAPEDSLGFFDATEDCSVFFDLNTYPPIARLRDEIDHPASDPSSRRQRLADRLHENISALLAQVVQHEVAHQLHHHLGVLPFAGDVPDWVAEGLAQTFELPFVERGATLELSTNRYRLFEFTRLYADRRTWDAALRRLVAADDWRGGKDYALSWALTDYLYKRHRTQFASYLRQLAADDESASTRTARHRADFERVFGTIDPAFIAGFDEHMQRLRARVGAGSPWRAPMHP